MAKFGDRVMLADGSVGTVKCEVLDFNWYRSYEVEVDDKYDEDGFPITMEVAEHDLCMLPEHPIYEEV